ncbi:MAG: accessory Sec system translocase SecA2 [Paenibacillaceae bacterium]
MLGDILNQQVNQLSDEQLRDASLQLIGRARAGSSPDSLLIEAFAIASEAAWRVLGMRPYDVQMIAGMALHHGKLIEMQTGEGKTLAAVLPAYLNAMPGKGMHILTFNDYLAKRDAEWMGPVYEFLGLTVGAVQEGMNTAERRRAYAADITYVTAKEAGFDYLKDSLCEEVEDLVHRPFQLVVVDEADSILIDEARIPLVIAGERLESKVDMEATTRLVKSLIREVDYDMDENQRNVYLTECGMDKAEAALRCGPLYNDRNASILTRLNCALHAEALLKRDIDYIVRDGKVELIDEFTGRVADNRHWPDGIQAAVEEKEGLSRQVSGRILGTITLQHYLSYYPRICGMTATARTSATELRDTYNLAVITIPPNRTCRRVDDAHIVFTHKEAKQQALIEEIRHVHLTGRPILIGTASVEESDLLAADLLQVGIPCHVLNAKNDEMEADIIARAGSLSAVTVSTNMAGRGVDIALGAGNKAEADKVAELGGLYVIGTNLHECVRIDNQLRGRAGRQGDPGSSKFWVSLEDDLMVRYGIEKVIPSYLQLAQQEAPLIDDKYQKALAHIQRVIDGQNVDIRHTLTKYADLVEQQRRILYRKRRDILIDKRSYDVLLTRDPQLYQRLVEQIGEERLSSIERRIALFQIDQCWADYLEHVAYIREGIHLESISNRDPLHSFHNQIIDAYEHILKTIEDKIVSAFRRVDVTKENLNLEQEGLKRPSSTWTYMINDQLFKKRFSMF